MLSADTPAGAVRTRRSVRPDPLRSIWRLLTSVRFALWLIGALSAAVLVGTLLPQAPPAMRANPAAMDAWLNVQETRFGALTQPLAVLGLFDVFHSPWFLAGLAVLVVSVCVCTANRWAPVWRTVMHPPLRVPAAYFQRARHRAEFPTHTTASDLAWALRRRRFRVSSFETATATELFADRFAWARFGTFVSHLSLIVLLAGGLVSCLGTVEQAAVIPEGSTAGIFSPTDRRHMQVRVDQAIGRFSADGRPVEFRSFLTLMQNGRIVSQGETSVNDPLRFAGFRLHQSSFSADGAALRVVDRRSGRTIYHETLLLAGAVPAPIVDIRDGGASRYRGVIATGAVPFPTASAERLSFTLTGSGRSNDATVEPRNRDAWTLLVSDRAGRTGPSHRLGIGQSAGIADLTVEFVGVQTMPALRLPELPGFPDGALLRMAPDGVDPGRSALVIAGSGGPARVLRAGVPSNVAGDLEYTFDGPRGVSGITVRRDPGTWLVWTAVAMLIGGLAITFYVPSRRLWVRLSDGRAAFAGQAGMTGDFPAEVKQIHADAERRRPVDR